MQVIESRAEQSEVQETARRSRNAHLQGDAAIAHAALEIWSRYARGLPEKLGWPVMTTLATIIEFGIHGAASRGGARATVEWPEVVDVVERAIKRLRPEEARIAIERYLGLAG